MYLSPGHFCCEEEFSPTRCTRGCKLDMLENGEAFFIYPHKPLPRAAKEKKPSLAFLSLVQLIANPFQSGSSYGKPLSGKLRAALSLFLMSPLCESFTELNVDCCWCWETFKSNTTNPRKLGGLWLATQYSYFEY